MKSQKLKVFIDASPLKSGHAVRGIGSYTRSLLDTLKKYAEIKLVSEESEADVVHYPYFDLFSNTLKIINKPTVVTVFDTIPLIYPDHYPTGIRGKFNFLLQKRKLGLVDTIVAISETSKKDIVRFLDVPPEKIHIIYLAPGQHFKKLARNTTTLPSVVEKYRLPEKFILYVGDVNYNKNIPGLLTAFQLLTTNYPLPIFLVLVGEAFMSGDLPETKAIFQLIEKFKIGDRIIIPGFVPPEDLVKIYNLATVYCQPSFYEGFGLPIFEAMARGTPVVAAKTQALVEIAEGAAVFVNPKDPENIAGGLRYVLSDKKAKDILIKRGIECQKKYSWEKTAKATINVYKKVINER